MARAAPLPSSGGAVMWLASSLIPKPTNSASIVAPRALAWARLSSTTTPAPSPSTKPSRSLSKGREALVGSPLRVERACIAPKPDIPSGLEPFSLPPASITSTSPYAIKRAAIPIAWVAVVQAVEVARFGPFKVCLIATKPAAILTIEPGMIKGDTFSAPFSRRVSRLFSMV